MGRRPGLEKPDGGDITIVDRDIVTLADVHAPLRTGDAVAIAPINPHYFDAHGGRIT